MTNPYLGVDISSIPEDEHDPYYYMEPSYSATDAIVDMLDVLNDDNWTDDEAIDEIEEILNRYRNA